MSGPWENYAKQAPTSGPWTKYAEPAAQTSAQEKTPEPSFLNTLGREAKAAGGAIAGIPGGIYHAIADPETAEEKEQVHHVPLAIERLSGGRQIANAIDWYTDAAQGKIPNAYEQALSVAPEAIGAGGGTVLAGKLIDSAPRAIGRVGSAIAKDPKGFATAPIRLAARTAESVANQKLIPLRKIANLNTPADEAEGLNVKMPGRDFGLAGPKPIYPGAPEPTATPEQLNPSLVSESRTLPGQVGKEVIGRVARPEAIPPRSGLMLPSAKEPISTVQHPNFPTPESRAASDASFARRHPNADFQSGMSPDAERAWQESAGFKSEPAIDIGAKVRAANPEPTRAESRTGPIGHSEWPPPEPEGPYSQVPKRPRGIIDVQDDAAVKQEVQNRIASSDQKWMAQASAERAARNSPAVRKGVLTGQVDELGIPISPVGKPTGPRGLSPAAPEATDLTPEWTKALEDLKAKKGQKGNLGD